jgi:transposase-like protein
MNAREAGYLTYWSEMIPHDAAAFELARKRRDETIREAVRAGLSVRAVARVAGVSASTVQRIAGKR